MSFATQVKDTLLADITAMDKHHEDFSKNPEKDFSRRRKMDFQTLLHFMISMESGSINHELMKYFQYSDDAPTLSAFYQQRAKLKENTLQELLCHFNSHYMPTLYKNKYQLIACDGSSFTFTKNPSDEDSYYQPSGRSKNGYNQIHLVPLFDLLSQRYFDAVIQPVRKKNEFLALSQLMEQFTPVKNVVPIFIADRGFHSYNVFAHAIEKGSYFVIRAKDLNVRRLLGADFPQENVFDLTVDRILTRSHSKKKYRHPELVEQYRCICKAVTFDYLPDDKYDEYPIRLRVIRFPISENSYENIITNLSAYEFPLEEIKYIYGLRWYVMPISA